MTITKVSGHVIEPTTNITSHNINSSGIITATRFDGPIGAGLTDGNFSGIITSTQLNVTGVGTFNGIGVTSLNVSGVTTFSDHVNVADTKKLKIGNDGDVEFYFDGSSVSRIDSIGTGRDLEIRSDRLLKIAKKGNGALGFQMLAGDEVGLYHAGNKKINTTSSGVSITGICTATDFSGAAGGAADFPNGLTGTTATFSGSVSIGGTLTYEDVTNIDSLGIVTARTGIKVLAGGANVVGVVTASAGIHIDDSITHIGDNAAIRFPANDTISFETGAVEKLRITSVGAILTGNTSSEPLYPHYVTARKIQAEFKGAIDVGQTRHHGSLAVNCTNSNSFIGLVRSDNTQTDGTSIGVIGWTGFDGTDFHQAAAIMVEKGAGAGNDDQPGHMIFKTNSGTTSATERLRIASDGHILPGAADTQDLGSTSKEFRNLYVGNSGRVYLGSAQEVSLYHDGNNTYLLGGSDAGLMQIKNIGGGDVELFSNDKVRLRVNGGENAVVCNNNNSVDLYYDASVYSTPKLKTSHYGVTIDGEVASSQDYPTIRPTLDLNFASVKKLDPRISYSRTGPASYTDEFGKLIKVAANAPRFDHNFGTGESLGLLLEESSTNISRYSEKASGTTNWNQFGSISENVIEAPDGSMTADKLEAPVSGYGLINIAGSWTANNAHTFSIFAKSAEWNRIGIRIYDGTSYYIRTNINLDTGEVVSGNNGAGTLRVDKFANGWWRISVTGTPVSTYTYNSHICVEPHNAAIVQNADPSSSKEGIYIWGWQMEQKAFPTSYIPTNGAEVTRGVDNVKIDGTEFTDFYNQSEGTLLSEFTINDPADANSLTSGAIANINALSSDSYANSIMFMEIGNANGYFGRVYKSSNGTQLMNGSSVIADLMGGAGPDRVSFAWSDTVVDEGLAAYWNGSVVNTSATETNTPTNMTELRIGRGWGSQYINAHIKRLSYYPKRLPDTQLKTLTS